MPTSASTSDYGRDLSIADAAERYGTSQKTIRRRIADGTLDAYRLGARLIRIRAESLSRLETPVGWAGKR